MTAMNAFASHVEDNLTNAGIFLGEARLTYAIEKALLRSDAPQRMEMKPLPGSTVPVIESMESFASRFTRYLIQLAFPLSEGEDLSTHRQAATLTVTVTDTGTPAPEEVAA